MNYIIKLVGKLDTNNIHNMVHFDVYLILFLNYLYPISYPKLIGKLDNINATFVLT